MKHIVFFYHFITLIITAAGFFLVFSIYLREKFKLLKHYLIFFGIFSIFFITASFMTYIYANIIKNVLDLRIGAAVGYLIKSLFCIFLYHSYFYIFKKINKNIKLFLLKIFPIFVITSFLAIIFLITNFMTRIIIFRTLCHVLDFLNIGLLLHIIFKFKKYSSLIDDVGFKKIFKISVILYTGFLINSLILYLLFTYNRAGMRPARGFIFPSIFNVLNYFNIYSAIKYYRWLHKKVKQGISNEFIEKFLITNREKDIILLIKEGNSNKEIAEKLSISINTVKSILYNLFIKTKVKNRVSLIKLVDDY